MTRAISTSIKPLGYYVTVPEDIEEMLGSRFENLDKSEQLAMLAAFTRYIDRTSASGGATDGFSLYDCYMDGYGTIDCDDAELERLFNEIENLSDGTILGLCEPLIANLLYTTEVR